MINLIGKPLASIIFLVLTLAATVVFAQTPLNPTSNPPANTTAEPLNPPATSSTSSNPNPAAGVSAPSGYQLSPSDSIAVEVFGEGDLKTSARLNGEGNVSLPLLGSVHLGGLSVTQATARVTELYARDYLVHPRVNVTLLGYAKRRFTVLGQVNRPGNFDMPEGTTDGIDLLEAIGMAGGYTRIAAPGRVSVRRKDSVRGEQVFQVDGKRVARGQGGGFKVEPGDTITVGESIF